MVDEKWSVGWKFETKSIKASSSSLVRKAAPTMSSTFLLCNFGVNPERCSRIRCSTYLAKKQA